MHETPNVLLASCSRRRLFAFPAMLGLLPIGPSLATAQQFPKAVTSPTVASEDFAGLVDVGGGRRLWLACRGEGGPTVILEAGYRSPARVWTDDLVQPDAPRTTVLAGVASFTRVCAYERPGTSSVIDDVVHPSRSDPVPMPRTADSVVADLHALLRAADVPGPYVLVGHSLGGLFVRLYAATYPDAVAGLVLIDAWSEELRTLLTPEQWALYVRFNSLVPEVMSGDAGYETLDFDAASETMEAAAAAYPLPALPLAVLAKGQPFGIPSADLEFDPAILDRAWREAQQGLAELGSGTNLIVAEASSHYIQLQQPDLVIAAIESVVGEVRGSWHS